MTKGEITHTSEVICGGFGCGKSIERGDMPASLPAALLLLGWRYVDGKGWLCPACVKKEAAS